MFASFIAMMMVAHLGELPLAAGFLAATSSTTILVLVSSFFYAVGIRIRFYQGQNSSPEWIGKVVQGGLLWACVLTIPSAFVLFFMDKLLAIIGQEPKLVQLTTGYFFYAGLGILPMLFMMVIGQFYVGIGKSYFTFITGFMNLLLTVLFSYLLVLGHLGFPKMGLAGVSVANLLAQLILLTGVLFALWFSGLYRSYGLFNSLLSFDWKITKGIFHLGLPIGIQMGGELIAMACANYLMGYCGVDALAALQVTSQYTLIVIMLNFGLAQAMSCLVSEAYGKQAIDYYLLKQYLYAALLILFFYLLPVAFLFFGFSTELTEFYLDASLFSSNFTDLTSFFFRVGFFFVLFDGLRNLLSNVLRGLHDTKMATRINLIAMWGISLPASYFMLFKMHGGPIGLRISFLSGFIAAVVALAFFLYKKIVKQNGRFIRLRPNWEVSTQ